MINVCIDNSVYSTHTTTQRERDEREREREREKPKGQLNASVSSADGEYCIVQTLAPAKGTYGNPLTSDETQNKEAVSLCKTERRGEGRGDSGRRTYVLFFGVVCVKKKKKEWGGKRKENHTSYLWP